MSKILITGANGLLGRNLTNKLLAEGHEIYAVTKEAPKDPIKTVEYIPIDLSTNWSVKVLPQKIDKVIHLAQSKKFRDFPENALDVFKVNIESTAKLLDFSKSNTVNQFIYTSSGGVYGNGARALDENSPINPPGKLGYYLGSKTCGEILVQSYASLFNVVVLRPFFIYGPRQNRSMLIPRLMDLVAYGKPVTLHGEHGLKINPIHVDDASQAVAATLNLKQSATLNIAGPEVLSIYEICNGMGRYLKKVPIFEKQPGEAVDLIADTSLMCKKLHVPQKRLFEKLDDIAD